MPHFAIPDPSNIRWERVKVYNCVHVSSTKSRDTRPVSHLEYCAKVVERESRFKFPVAESLQSGRCGNMSGLLRRTPISRHHPVKGNSSPRFGATVFCLCAQRIRLLGVVLCRLSSGYQMHLAWDSMGTTWTPEAEYPIYKESRKKFRFFFWWAETFP